jgi:pimeloyl-ACP methyl ester carboxylesterase
MPFFTSDGANVYIDVAGQGTSVLFVHGFALDHRQWMPQREALVETYRILRLDVRGHGRSASATSGHSWDRLVEDVRRAMVQAGMQRLQPGFLVGHAMSADAVLQAALAEPRALKGVVVASPAVWGMKFSDTWNGMLAQMRTLVRDGRVDAALDVFRNDEIFSGVRSVPDLEANLRNMQDGFSGDPLRSDESAQGEPTLERMHGCKVPLLVIRARGDRQDFKDAASEIASRAPRAHVVEIASGHFSNLEAPDEFNRALLDFFREHE